MRRGHTIRDRVHGPVAANIVARILALGSLGAATILVARISGASGVGVFVLLRVLPGLAGVLASGGLPSAVAFFLARDHDERLRPTIVTMMVASGTVAALVWIVAAPALDRIFFGTTPLVVVAVAGISVFTQMLVAVAKGCSQGLDDMKGANRVIVLEEFAFLPVYGALWLTGIRGWWLLLGALIAADLITAGLGWARLARRGFFTRYGKASIDHARIVWWYGTRGQIGGMFSLVNLRLDFVLLGAFASTAVVGSYAVASKFAELLRLPSLAITYVLYPRFSRDSPNAATQARSLIGPAAAFTLVAAVPLGFLAVVALPLLYGSAFRSAVLPAQILLVGLSVEGAAGVVTAYLYGIARPGLNSIAMGVGVLLTVMLDAALIPTAGAIGAAVASSVAYLGSTAVLLWFFHTHAGWPKVTSRPVELVGETR
jgi:O-antigen/teichoic acid export membrane protein